MYESKFKFKKKDSDKNKLKMFEILTAEANMIREKDKVLIRGLFQNFYNKKLNVGIGFQRAYGSILSGDYFDLIKLPDGNYLFIFADVSGHGLPAYTSLIRLRSAITLSIGEMRRVYEKDGVYENEFLVKSICNKFTDIMEESNSHDFVCVVFTFIENDSDKFHLTFYNRSMLFPIVVRKYENDLVDIYNLNVEEKGWKPYKGYLLGSDVRELLGDNYLDTPSCKFTLYEGDSILFFSDGIIEAYNKRNPVEEYGEQRIMNIISDLTDLNPQVIVNELFDSVYEFMGNPECQKDDMTAVLIDFPTVRN